MKTPRKPRVTPAMRAVIANLKAGRSVGYGLPHTQSHAAGLGCTLSAMQRRGWITRCPHQLTEEGAQL